MADGRIIILVDADTKGYDRAFAEMTATAKTQTAKTSSALTSAADKLTSFGGKATKALTLPIAAAATASVAAAVSIDTSLTNVKKTVDGTDEQYRKLKASAIEFSRTNAVSASQILDLQSLGAQLGFNIDELDKFSQVASGLDIATDMNAEQAASEMAQFANITKMAHGDIERYGSSIVALGNNLATTESQVSAMGQRIAAAGTQTKMSQAEILGWAGAMSSLGIEAEAGGTAFSTTISTIDAAVAKGGEDLQTFAKIAGMSSKQFADSWKSSATETMQTLLKGVDGAENMTIALEEMGVDGIRQSDVLKRLAGNTELVSNAINISNDGWRENSALSNEVANRNESLAAKFEMLKNRGIEVLEKVGSPLADALLDVAEAAEPVIDGIADLAEAFSNADKGTQTAILGAVAFAAAIGPVATVTGKTLGVIDKLNTGYTKLSTGIKKASSSVSAGNATFAKYTTMATRGNTAVVKWDKSTQTYVQTQSKLAKVLGTTTVGTKAQAAAQTISNTAMKAGTVVARTLGTALKTIAPIAAISAVISIVTSLTGAMADAKQKAETYEKATKGVVESLNAMNQIDTSQFSQAVESVSVSLDDVIQKSADFAQSQAETWGDVQGKNAAISAFADTIAKYANQTNLGAEEQAKLSAAVAGYNELTGESVKILDLQNGKLDTSTDKIIKNAEAWKLNAQMQALSQRLVEEYDLLYEAEIAQTQASDELTAAQERLAAAQEAVSQGALGMEQELYDASKAVADATLKEQEATGVVDGHRQAIEQIAGKYGELAFAQQSTVEGISAWITGNEELKQSFENIDLQTFSGQLSQLGFDTENLSKVGTANMKELAANFNGNITDIISTCEKAGIEIPGKLGDGIYQGSGGVTVAANSMAAQVMSELTGHDYTSAGGFVAQGMAEGIDAQSFEAAAKARGMSDETIAAIKEALDIHSPSGKARELGTMVPAGLAEGMSGSDEPQSAAEMMGANVLASLTGSLEPAGQLGTDTGTAFADAITGTASLASSAGDFVAQMSKQGMTKLPQFQSLGTTTGARFATGVGNTAGTARSKGDAVASAAKAGMNMLSAFSTLGSQSGTNFANGVGERKGDAGARGRDVSNAAKTGINQYNNSASTWGSHLVENFASGLRGAVSFVTGAANFIANSAKGIIGFSVPDKGPWAGSEKGGETSGRHLVENFAQGMIDGLPSILEASNSIAGKLYKELSALDAPSIALGVSIDDISVLDRLSALLDGVSAVGIISGNVSIEAFGHRLESIESKMDIVAAKLDDIDRGIKQMNARLMEPMDIHWNKRELGRLIREV